MILLRSGKLSIHLTNDLRQIFPHSRRKSRSRTFERQNQLLNVCGGFSFFSILMIQYKHLFIVTDVFIRQSCVCNCVLILKKEIRCLKRNLKQELEK